MNDLEVAKLYLSKSKNAAKNGHEFTLTFMDYKRLVSKKKCQLTGLEFTAYSDITLENYTVRTIDRLDNSRGYVKGNVAAVCSGVNHFKSIIEDPTNPLTLKMVGGIIEKTHKLIKLGAKQ